MEMDWMQAIQSLGFPIAIAAVMLWYMSKITTRNMDEAKERETNYQKILTEYGIQMRELSNVLLKVNASLADARIEHKEIMRYVDCVEDAKQAKLEAERNNKG